jgi:hypothetical protein
VSIFANSLRRDKPALIKVVSMATPIIYAGRCYGGL